MSLLRTLPGWRAYLEVAPPEVRRGSSSLPTLQAILSAR